MNRAARRRGEPLQSRQKQLLMVLGVFVIVLAGAAAIVFALVAGDGDDTAADTGDGDRPLRTPSTGGSVGGPEPVLEGPVIRFAASQEEVGGGIQGDPSESRDLTPEIYADAQFGPFTDINQGREKVNEWGYEEGHIGIMVPDGRVAGVALGRYYVRQETHIFATVSGAIAAFEWYEDLYDGIEAVEPVDAPGLANQSRAWKGIDGKVENTELDLAYHRFIFRRGNLIGIVQTSGADTFMTIDPARDIAVIIDERALGNRAAPTPTPSGRILPPTPVPDP